MSDTSSFESPGLSAFDALRAEDEPWLSTCFVPPSDFPLIAGARSIILYGDEGSGKTTLYHMLLRYLRPTDRPPNRLVVEWRLPLLDPKAPIESSTAELIAADLIATCCAELSLHISRWPESLAAIPSDTHNTIAWFLQRYNKSPRAQPSWVELPPTSHDDFLDHANIPRRLSELIKVVKEIGLSGVWVLAAPEDSYTWAGIRPGLLALMSSLNFLDQPQLSYKFILSTSQRSELGDASGIERRRFDLIPLRWLTEDLVAIVERHLAVATAGSVTRLVDLCADDYLADWLGRTGGNTPRGWLGEIRPLIAYYFARSRTISSKEWRTIRRQRPPRFIMNTETGHIVVGYREIDDVGTGDLAVLRYLFENRGRICTRDELFHKAYLPGINQSTERPTVREYPKEFEGTFDNVLWRLRGAIEPDPKDPIYVVTYRGQGVRLENV